MTTMLVPGDKVIWRYDDDEWLVAKIMVGHPRPIWLVHRMYGGEGPLEIGHARRDEVVKICGADQSVVQRG